MSPHTYFLPDQALPNQLTSCYILTVVIACGCSRAGWPETIQQRQELFFFLGYVVQKERPHDVLGGDLGPEGAEEKAGRENGEQAS